MKLQYIIIPCLALLLTLPVDAQKIKYKNLYEDITSGKVNNDILLTQLKEHKKAEPEEGNQYYQLGRIYAGRTKQFDVLMQITGALQVADSAIHYLTLAKRVIDEKEVKRKDEYYASFLNTPEGKGKDEVTIAMVYKNIDRMVIETKKFKTNAKKIHDLFNDAINNYYAANDIFTEIYSTYTTYKEMALIADDAFLRKLAEMKFYFDEGVGFLKQYQEAIKAYPIEGYNQQYQLAEILNYRLHGLTKASFLQNNISLWNYGKWHDEILLYLKNEIGPLRKTVEETELALNKKTAEINKSAVPDDEEYRIAPESMMLIRKYDPGSFLVDVFKYKEANINVVNSKILALDSIDFSKRSRRYASTLFYARAALRSLDHATNNMSEKSTNRHRVFMGKYYKQGVPAFISSEKKAISPEVSKSVSNLKGELVLLKSIDGALQKYDTLDDGQVVPLFKSPTSRIDSLNNEYVTLDIFEGNGFSFISGYQYTDGKRKAFVAYYVADRLQWMSRPKTAPDMESEAMTITSVGQGSACLVFTYAEGDKANGHTLLAEFTNQGKEMLQTRVANTKFPKDIIYTPADNLFACIFENYNEQEPNMAKTVYISKIDQEGLAEWEAAVNITGEAMALTPFRDGLVLTCNVREAMGSNGDKMVAGTSNGTNVFSVFVGPDGSLKDHFLLKSPTAHFATYVLNSLDKQINIFGFKGMQDGTPLDSQELMVIWLNSDLYPLDENSEQ
ncbi:MAG: hypothetical protein OEX02_03295 [Cyclobacteriaceae bacterium]|nr:hypothetical protein [Cyclobacteriaceae bacterium]